MISMIKIEAKIYIQTNDSYPYPLDDKNTILVKSDGPYSSWVKLIIDGKEYAVVADELIQAIQRCSKI